MQHNPTGNGHPPERTSWLNRSLYDGIIWALRTAIPATQRKWKEWSTLKLNRKPRLMDVGLLKRARNGDLNAANDAGAAIWKDQKSGARLDAEQWFRRAAEGGHPLGMTNLATLLRETGRNEEAARWDLAAAGSGDAQAMYNRAVCYQNGNGVPIDVNEALSWYRKAAAKGFRDAQFNLGQILLYGQITPANVPEAAHWFKLAAEQEDPQAMFLLGGILAGIFGDAVPHDPQGAAYWTIRAAEKSFIPAYFNAALSYDQGMGIAPDRNRAIHFYRLAAHHGDANASLRLRELGG